MNVSDTTVIGKAWFSFWSWGEDMMVQLIHRGDLVLVHFTSECTSPIQVLDWEKNKRNEVDLLTRVHKLMGEGRSELFT